MNQVITIKPNPVNQNSVLAVHPQTAAAFSLSGLKFASVSFGNRKHYVEIKMNPEIAPENILLSQNLIEELYLPEYPSFEIRLNLTEIVIGPYIGLLLSNTNNRLTTSRLNKTTVCLKEYTKLHGAVVVFALDKISKESQLIEGYCYNPVKKYWQPGIFPYPAAIYRTIGLNAEWKNHFLTVIGDKIFNSRFFGKWEMYQWFSKEPLINPHLPYTVLYHSPRDVFKMLERFSKVYIKPVLGLQGRGIVRISLENTLFIIKYRENKVNHIITFDNPEAASEYINKRFRRGRYLIQQAVELLEYQGGIIDFRCAVQKNQSDEWACLAVIGRSGAKDSVVSNISSGGAAVNAEKIFREVFPASEEHIAGLKKKIAAFAITICKKLDEYGINCGTLGLDIGMDRLGDLWLIEINNRDPDPSIALDTHDMQLFYDLKTGPLFYAKFLAGFKKNK